MAIVGIGLDIAEIVRFERSLERYGERFLKRCFHETEQAECARRRKKGEFLAGRFAAKEAGMKAMGIFPGRGLRWWELYVTYRKGGQPVLNLLGRAKALADELGVTRIHLSITHDGGIAAAEVIMESDAGNLQ